MHGNATKYATMPRLELLYSGVQKMSQIKGKMELPNEKWVILE